MNICSCNNIYLYCQSGLICTRTSQEAKHNYIWDTCTNCIALCHKKRWLQEQSNAEEWCSCCWFTMNSKVPTFPVLFIFWFYHGPNCFFSSFYFSDFLLQQILLASLWRIRGFSRFHSSLVKEKRSKFESEVRMTRTVKSKIMRN